MPKPYPSEFREDVVGVARSREPGVARKAADERAEPPQEAPAGERARTRGVPGRSSVRARSVCGRS